ncbi:AAA family ATPase [Bradyrhizobium elkanii]|uniref:AAA family ATPase n=1 Tax=Bradyrhizobium elkanii TaxID=29448 RepID=UPI0004275123|nr:AAA family ATPase [Bradyrhizobium elkanii]
MTAASGDTGVTGTVTSPRQGASSTDEEPATGNNKQFMEQVVVWPGSATAPGWINLHCHLKNTDPSKNGGKDYVVGWPKKTVDDFLSMASWVESTSQFFDVWFCTSQQHKCGTSKTGKAKAVRNAQNATWLKAIWIDCDVKPDDTTGKHYTSMQEARAAIVAFYKAVGLPAPSAVVDSGGGLHVYWIADAPMAPDEWRGYAEGLKAVLIREGIKCDAGLTTDCARILRTPGTLNHKYAPPRPVKLMHWGQLYDFPAALSVLRGLAPTKSAVKASSPSLVPAIEPGQESRFENGPDSAFASLTGVDDLAAGIARRSGVPLDPGPIFEKCGFMRHARDTGGVDYDNTLWMYSVLCATFLEDGNAIAHEISKGHPSYTEAETQRMYERKLADRAERGIGSPGCATIKGAGCTSCATCPFFTQGKSPLHLTGAVTATVNPGSTMAAPAIWSPADLRVKFSNIRHRRTLYGYDLVRGEITVLASPGGFGKSSLAIGMAISIATGKELLGEKIRGSDLKVLLINAEDSTDEIWRRVWAFCLAHGVTELELDRLYAAGADDPCVQSLAFLQTNDKGYSKLDAAGLAQLRAQLQVLSPDVIVLDPLVALCASGNMNDNASMSLVMRALKGLAAEFDCAILIVHHTRKNAEAGAADAISGAASIVNLARRAIMPVIVSAEEAPALAILPSERLRHFKLVDAKSNLAPRSTDLPVYRLHSVELPNDEPPTYPFGDNVQAVVRVQLPSQVSGGGSTDDPKIRQAILDLVKRGKTIDGKVYPYSPSPAGADNVRSIMEDAVAAVEAATAPRQWAPGDLEAVVKAAIKNMQREGALASSEIKGTGRFRRGQGLQVNPSLTANGDTDAAETEVAD